MYEIKRLDTRPHVNAYFSGRPISYKGICEGEHAPMTNLACMASLCGDGTEVIIPDVRVSNGKVVYSDDLRRKEVFNDVTFWRGANGNHASDGVVISQGQSVAIASADCPVIVVTHPEKKHVVVAHASRQSLIGNFEDHGHWRPFQKSVVYNIVSRFSDSCRRGIKVWILLRIHAKDFLHHPNDKEYGEKNKSMIDFVCRNYGEDCFDDLSTGALSLRGLIAKQFISLGVPLVNIESDEWDTYADENSAGEYRWWSNRRGDRDGRNLVFVVFPR